MYPVVRKGQIYTPVPTGYGASVERYQKRFSKRDEAKLQKKLAKLQTTLSKLQAKTSRLGAKARLRRMARIQKKISAIQTVLGMQPFEQNLTQQAYDEQMMIAQQGDFNPLWLILGAVVISGVAFVVVKQKRKPSKR